MDRGRGNEVLKVEIVSRRFVTRRIPTKETKERK
jgi:hypothetical protein